MIQTTDSSLVVDVRATAEYWCIFEHQAVMVENEPPETILIGACKLNDVYRLVDGKQNSEWARIYKSGGSVVVRIVGLTTDRNEAYRTARIRVNEMEVRPRCNALGFALIGNARSVKCINNGETYTTQAEAAKALGIHTSTLSRHLRGELATAQGLHFEYASNLTAKVDE